MQRLNYYFQNLKLLETKQFFCFFFKKNRESEENSGKKKKKITSCPLIVIGAE